VEAVGGRDCWLVRSWAELAGMAMSRRSGLNAGDGAGELECGLLLFGTDTPIWVAIPCAMACSEPGRQPVAAAVPAKARAATVVTAAALTSRSRGRRERRELRMELSISSIGPCFQIGSSAATPERITSTSTITSW
jgi:hypothetical protein